MATEQQQLGPGYKWVEAEVALLRSARPQETAVVDVNLPRASPMGPQKLRVKFTMVRHDKYAYDGSYSVTMTGLSVYNLMDDFVKVFFDSGNIY
jgi:hypothetical protein